MYIYNNNINLIIYHKLFYIKLNMTDKWTYCIKEQLQTFTNIWKKSSLKTTLNRIKYFKHEANLRGIYYKMYTN